MRGERQTRFLIEGFEVVMVPDINVRDTLARDEVMTSELCKTKQGNAGLGICVLWSGMPCACAVRISVAPE